MKDDTYELLYDTLLMIVKFLFITFAGLMIWNNVITDVFNLQSINYIQMVALYVFTKILLREDH